MFLRVLQLLIVVVWLGSTVLLIRRTYFPDEGRYPAVPVEDVASLFFIHGKPTDLAILRDGRQFGRLNVNPRYRPTHPPVEIEGETEIREIFFSGFLTEEAKDTQLGQLSWNGSIYVNPEVHLLALRIAGRAPQVASGSALIAVDPPRLSYEIRQGREVVLSSTDPAKTRATLEEASQLLGDLPLDFGALENAEQQLGPALALLRPQVDCRHGQFKMFGDRYDGFILTLTFVDEWKLRFYLSELGELLKVDGIPNLVILGEAFVPQDTAADQQ